MSDALATPKIARPVMRYPGGKWVIARHIIRHFPPHRIYIEPYGGAASVLLQKRRVYAEIYNDLDGEVVNVFRVMQNLETAAELERLIRFTPFARAEFELGYEPAEDPVERARRTLIKSFMGHGSDSIHRRSGYRSRGFRQGCTPAMDWKNYPKHIKHFTERLQGVNLETRPALELFGEGFDTSKTLYLVDPPYVTSTRQAGMYAYEMTDADHVRLLETLLRAQGMVLVCGYDHEIYRDMLAGWRLEKIKAFADGARPRTEMLWISPNCPPPQGRLEIEEE